MWKSPIEITEEITKQMNMVVENGIIKAVQRVGIDVDKEELLKALQYDRGQYEKGYQDGLNANKWIPCSERLPTEKEAWDYNAENDLYEPNEFIVQVKGAKLPTVAMFDGETFTHGYAEDGYGFMDEIIAWMPLPPVYKGE